MDKRNDMLDEWIKILKGKWKGDYTHLAIYDYGKAANWRYDECPSLPERCFSKSEFDQRLAEIVKENETKMNESTLVPSAAAKQSAITPSKYTKTIRGVSVDVYDVLQAWGVSNPALQHLIKKALQCGQRGHKDNAQDLQDIIDSAIRAKELEC